MSPSRPVASSASSATRRDRSNEPALHSAAARMTSDLTRVPRRAERRRQLDGAFGVADRGGAVAAGHRQLGAHPRQPDRQPRGHRFGAGLARALQESRGRREPAHAQRVGGQSDQRVRAGFGVPGRQRPCPAVLGAGTGVPAELAQKRRMRAVRQRGQRAGALSRGAPPARSANAHP